MAIAQNIIIDQDANYSQQFTAKTGAGVVIDLTGYGVTAKIRKSFASSTSTGFGTNIDTPTTGLFTLTLTSTETAALERGRHVYDVVIDLSGTKTRVQSGVATVSPSVTR